MGLISEEVEVVLGSKNIKYYEDLGYKIPRSKDKQGRLKTPRGTTIIVDVKDLSNGSHVYVDIKCDSCEKELKNMSWQGYLKYVKSNGKYYCYNCAIKQEMRNKNRIKTLLNNGGKSFEQWCIENNRQDVLDRWDYELNDCKPSEITYGTKNKYYFKCSKGIHKSELKNIDGFTSGQDGSINCNQCNSFAQWGIDNLGDDFLDKYWDYENNVIDPWVISKSNSNKKVWIKCQEKDYHGSYDILLNSFNNQNSRCPYCTRHKIHPLDSLGKLLEDKGLLHLWSDKNKKSPYKYAPYTNLKLWWKCFDGIHKDYKRNANDANRYNFRCPECQYSQGEERITNYFINKGFMKINQDDYKILDNNFKLKNLYYIPQKGFDNLIGLGGGNLLYDFYLPNLQYNLLIEYDGEYHYKPIRKYKNEPLKYAEERLKKQQEHDRLKDEYAKNHGINLLRIPYWDFDNIEKILYEYLNIT